MARRIYSSGVVHYYFADHLGRSRIVTNASGGILEDSDFYPFGGERVVVDTVPDQKFKFTGKERDAESGLDYFGARYYVATIGRFLSPDEFTGGAAVFNSPNDPLPPGPLPYADITNPQSLNKYSYVLNNPIFYIDPSGHKNVPSEILEGLGIEGHGCEPRMILCGGDGRKKKEKKSEESSPINPLKSMGLVGEIINALVDGDIVAQASQNAVESETLAGKASGWAALVLVIGINAVPGGARPRKV